MKMCTAKNSARTATNRLAQSTPDKSIGQLAIDTRVLGFWSSRRSVAAFSGCRQLLNAETQ